MDNVYTLQIFSQSPQIKHAISTKAFGSMKKDDDGFDFANLLKFAKRQKFPSMPICMNQIHGTTVTVIENDRELILSKTDGMVTNKRGLPLSVVTADCLPILFFDPEKETIGVAHAGRRGLLAGIIHEVVAVMKNTFGTDPKDLLVGVGPSIERNCYAVSEEIVLEFQSAFPEFINIFEQKNDHYLLDLRAVALQSLQKEGILEEHLAISEVCTKCDERFYSYRRGDRDKLFASVISLV